MNGKIIDVKISHLEQLANKLIDITSRYQPNAHITINFEFMLNNIKQRDQEMSN